MMAEDSVNGGKNGKKEGLSGSSFFTWFMVIALLGVWTSVAVVWFDLVDYEEVLAKAQDFRYNLSEALQGKLGVYDTDGDGDFDVDDAKILLGLKERSVLVPPAEDSEDDHPATQATAEPDDVEEEDIQDVFQPQDEADDLDKDLEEIVQDSLHESADDLDKDLQEVVEEIHEEAVDDLGKAFDEEVQDSPHESTDDLDQDLKEIVEDSYTEAAAADDLDKDLEEIVQESLHAEEDASETHEEADQVAEEEAHDEEPEVEKEVEAVETANVEAVFVEEQLELEVQDDEQAETTEEVPETEEADDNTVVEEAKVEIETESDDQELDQDVKAEPEIEEIYKEELLEEDAEEQPEPEVIEETEPEEEREEQVALDDNQETEHEPETHRDEEAPSESQVTEDLQEVIVDEHVTYEQEEEHHTEDEPQHTEHLEVEESQTPDEEFEPEMLEAPAVIENEDEDSEPVEERLDEAEEEILHLTEETIEEEPPTASDQEEISDHPAEGHLDVADEEILHVIEDKIVKAFEQLQNPAEQAQSEPEEIQDVLTEEILQDDKAEESLLVPEEQQETPTDEHKEVPEEKTEQPAGDASVTTDKKQKAKNKKPKLFNKFDKTIKAELDAAEKLRKKGKVDEALRAFESLVDKYPQSPKARYGKAQSEDALAEKMRSNDILLQAINTYGEVAELPNAPAELIKLTLKRRADRQQFLGRTRGSVVTLHKLVQLYPEDVTFRNELGVGYLLLGDNSNAKAVFEQVLAMSPNDGFAKVHYGFILKAENYIAESIPYLKEGLESGEPGTDDGRFYFHLGDALQRVGSQEAYIWYEAGHKKGHFASVWQRSLYNVNGLKAQPWWTAKETSYTDLVRTLEANWKLIRDEGLAVIDTEKGLFVPEDENLREKGDWSQYTLWQQGRKNEKSCAAAPRTCALLERFPESTGCRRGQIKYSVMHPGTHVWPHTGPTNCRLRMHLGLVIPKEGCRIRCANDTRSWEEGKVLIFDDSFEHEVWQEANSYRLIFIVDVWHPELTSYQRRTLPAI
ncbi:aspartyl/asparaginyl beta-hydroxylase isoform X4 [Xenopus tropicalis]|uniref:Aspartate beta-hydroxylase n=1 Tax=Xenopus tropicalis TaxID=8364 RepID=F6RBK4_XENTR|nr:aspartyl/asparaginyl beta-hydroxylase isoform X4 [Xenopus tropicalis]